jgi:predicted protein tyrosine phosphatase
MRNDNNKLKKQILFVCYLGKQRSPTAKNVFERLFDNYPYSKKNYCADYASLYLDKKITKKEIKNSYKVVALTKLVAKKIKKKYEKELIGKLQVLDLPLRRNNSKILVSKIEEYFNSKDWM